MTRVKILRTFHIALDGLHVQAWAAGSERDVDDATLALLIGEGACEIVEIKAFGAAPENKAAPRKRGRPRKVQP